MNAPHDLTYFGVSRVRYCAGVENDELSRCVCFGCRVAVTLEERLDCRAVGLRGATPEVM